MKKRFVLQGITQDNHLDEIRDAISIENVSRIIISVAFLNRRGFSLLRDILEPVAGKTVILAGIRNGITSAQGLLACVECGCKTYTVDTGSRRVVFHPKIYMSKNREEARLILGSANLTVGGLNSNIEASLKVVADLSMADDAALVADLEAKIDGMVSDFPDHVMEITALDKLDKIKMLLSSGRLIDESIRPAPSQGRPSGNRDLDAVPRMKLDRKQLKLATAPPIEGKVGEIAPDGASEDAETPNAPALPVPGSPIYDQIDLVWESKPLARRPLNIPAKPGTNPTGSMFFTKGQIAGIDQRHYFRETVFGALDWQHDDADKKAHLERAEAKFYIIIKGVNYGVFDMTLTHDSRTDSKAYKQRNSLTQLHWGRVKPLIARKDLLDRTMFLYRDNKQPNFFILEID